MTPEFTRSVSAEACRYLLDEAPSELMSDKLMSAFMWEYSPQGFAYWNNVYDTLYGGRSLPEDARSHIRVFLGELP